METEVSIVGNEGGKFEESWVCGSVSSLLSTKQITDPVMYKLVRVEGDGRLVPATDEEVMEVEGLLMDNKDEMDVLADMGQVTGCISVKGSSSGMFPLESSEGLSQSENRKNDPVKLNAQLEENVPSSVQTPSDGHKNQCVSVVECSNTSDNLIGGDSSSPQESPATITTSKPDFSRLKGEICLDDLSIKELHETFRATFGRETAAKDKLWLKRRITMGLTNSCDVSTTSFIIKDNKLVKKGGEEACNSRGVTFSGVATIPTTNDDCKSSSISHASQQQDNQVVSDKRNSSLDEPCESQDNQAEQRATKRARKPTRRYIEESSEVESRESSGRLKSPASNSTLGFRSAKSIVRPVGNISSDGRMIITRLDYLGGCSVQVPCVSRVRRSHPRTNLMALLTVNTSGVDKGASVVKKALAAHDFHTCNECPDKEMRAISAPALVQDGNDDHSEKGNQFLVMGAVNLSSKQESKHSDSSVNLVDNVVTVPTVKGGFRRKHHRAWTLSEVVKLVDGVSRYGAGRWSEIKKLSFASYSYRTSVDLKDKWRNLLKASFAQTPTDKGINSRKNSGGAPIPAPIMLKVRELAELQAQFPPNLNSSKLAGSIRTSVHERQPGYL